jgi:hypothetical protein
VSTATPAMGCPDSVSSRLARSTRHDSLGVRLSNVVGTERPPCGHFLREVAASDVVIGRRFLPPVSAATLRGQYASCRCHFSARFPGRPLQQNGAPYCSRLSGTNPPTSVVATGGKAEAAQVDALDGDAVETYTANTAAKAGRIDDVVFNAVGFQAVQGIPLIDLDREDFIAPIVTWTRTQFLTSRAAARHMMRQRSGVILTLWPRRAIGDRLDRRLRCRVRGR